MAVSVSVSVSSDSARLLFLVFCFHGFVLHRILAIKSAVIHQIDARFFVRNDFCLTTASQGTNGGQNGAALALQKVKYGNDVLHEATGP